MSDLTLRSVPGRGNGGGPAALAAAVKCLALDVVAARTWRLLTAADVPAVLIKGPATAQLLYADDPGRRTYTDVDVLVPVDRFLDAENVLRDNGYLTMLTGLRAGEFPWHETAWQAPGPEELVVDLHRGFAGVTDSAAFFTAVWASRTTLQLSGATVFIPGPAATALILMLHAANPGRNHKPLADIRRAHELFPPDVWRSAADLARRCGADSSCRAGLGLLPNGLTMADDIGLDGKVSTEQWLAGRQRDRISVNLSLALEEPGLWATASHIGRRLFPSPAFVRLFDPSVGDGPGQLLLAYLRRIQRVITATPRAIVDVLAARRATRWRPQRWRLVRQAVSEADGTSVRAAVWALRVRGSVGRQLRSAGLEYLDLPAPRTVRPTDRMAVRAVLRLTRATCLERSVVLQRFDAAAGRPRSLVIAVTAPGRDFRAHAWLTGEPQPGGAMSEILRRPPPAAWFTD